VERKAPGIIKLNTAQKARMHSMPKQQGQAECALELFLARKRLARLERECAKTRHQSERVEEDYEELSARIHELQAELGGRHDASPGPARQAPAVKSKTKTAPGLKTFDMQY